MDSSCLYGIGMCQTGGIDWYSNNSVAGRHSRVRDLREAACLDRTIVTDLDGPGEDLSRSRRRVSLKSLIFPRWKLATPRTRYLTFPQGRQTVNVVKFCYILQECQRTRHECARIHDLFS
jgi:hypothetical protein